MASEIKSNVDNCDYNQGMKCNADSIKVNMQVNREEVCSADATYCETFETREC